MTVRERFVAALKHRRPDRVPFFTGNPKLSALNLWRRQGLPEGVDWVEHLLGLLGVDPAAAYRAVSPGVNFFMIPEFEEKVLERRGENIVVQDYKGNVCLICGRFDPKLLKGGPDLVTRQWISCPVTGWESWQRIKERYDAADPARFPADLERRAQEMERSGAVRQWNVHGPFMQMRDWMGFEGLCLAFYDHPDLVRDMIEFWRTYVSRLLELVVRRVKLDHVIINEDMAYKGKSMVNPAMVRELMLPSWCEWCEILHAGGCAVVDMDSDGYVGELLPLWIEAGFDCTQPVEVAAGNDLPSLAAAYGARIGWRGGVDKRAMARGAATIEAELVRLAPVVKAGGYIPSCDHGIPDDVTWPRLVEYARGLARITGWA